MLSRRLEIAIYFSGEAHDLTDGLLQCLLLPLCYFGCGIKNKLVGTRVCAISSKPVCLLVDKWTKALTVVNPYNVILFHIKRKRIKKLQK